MGTSNKIRGYSRREKHIEAALDYQKHELHILISQRMERYLIYDCEPETIGYLATPPVTCCYLNKVIAGIGS